MEPTEHGPIMSCFSGYKRFDAFDRAGHNNMTIKFSTERIKVKAVLETRKDYQIFISSLVVS